MVASAQVADAQELRKISSQFKTEPGCPVDLVSAKTELEIDSFGAPSACRIYLDFKNCSAKQISAVKFRMGYIDEQEKIRRTFVGDDAHLIAPEGQAHQQWRVGVDPKTAYVVIRAIAVKYGDGSEWRSEKFKNPRATPEGAEGADPGSAEVGATDPDGLSAGAKEKQSAPASNDQRGSSSGSAGGAGEPATTPSGSDSSSSTSGQSDKSGGGY